MKMKPLSYLVILLMAVVMVSCFEEDQAVPAYVPPENVTTLSIPYSIYTNQIYFDFNSGNIVAVNENTEWVLEFESTDTGMHIRINSSDLWGLAHTGSVDMSADYSEAADYTWLSDKSDGNQDSTAAGEWVSFYNGDAVYTNEVMLMGQFDGISHNVRKKVQFIEVDEMSYTFLVDNPQASQADTVRIVKNPDLNYLQYSFENHEVRFLEPDNNDWDLLFTQYFTVLFTDDGIPAPYYVRGVWLNPNLVESALDTLTHFIDISASNALNNEFSSKQDAIGHDWKSVRVDESSNSAEYKVRPGYTYIVRDTDGELYKLRFKSYFNESGVKGFPSFEFAKLEKTDL